MDTKALGARSDSFLKSDSLRMSFPYRVWRHNEVIFEYAVLRNEGYFDVTQGVETVTESGMDEVRISRVRLTESMTLEVVPVERLPRKQLPVIPDAG